MSAPRATLRLQFHRGFTFADARPLVRYFAHLGISHVYSSPILTARPGSMHGYDVIDPDRINPELGGEDGFREFVDELRRHELGLILDIVPNHMAVGAGNRRWMDVLAAGPESRYAKFFDIDWSPPDQNLRNKVLLPMLGRPYGEALDAGEITLRELEAGKFVVGYFDHIFPVRSDDVATIADASIKTFDPGDAAGRRRLHELLERQHYRLAWWRAANDEINWRRFFDINELVAMRVEDDEVFEEVHATIFRLYVEGLVDGLQVDHIDGLAEPGAYCRKLRERLTRLEATRTRSAPSERAYFVVEKILARDESLPEDWQTDGTTGYDFMDEVDAMFHMQTGEQTFRSLWHRISGRTGDFEAEELLARHQVLERSFSAQREALVQTLYQIAASDLKTRDFSPAALRRVLSEILVHFPVYRIYARVGHASAADRKYLSQAIEGAKTTCLSSDVWLVEKLGQWLSGRSIRPEVNTLQAIALASFQQLSAPLCAKAVEDTAFYRYGRLISRNDVGFDARQFALSLDDFHRRMVTRQRAYPHSLLATATHDHKRGEDVRARLAVLSEMPDEWSKAVERWIARSAAHCRICDGSGPMPSAGDRAILFQTIVGSWPLSLVPDDQEALSAFSRRVAAWQLKAVREAKLHSDWSAPNEPYERASEAFVSWLFSGSSGLLGEIADFVQMIAPAGAVDALSQVMIKMTAPGVPDFYRGTEYWDFSLVDPDNRSPVDFAVRQKTVDTVSPAEAIRSWRDGRIKQALVQRVLALRKKIPSLFAEGAYIPLEVIGDPAEHVVAFARTWRNSAALMITCRHSAHLLADDGSLGIAPKSWENAELVLPFELQKTFANALVLGEAQRFSEKVCIAQIFGELPLAIWAAEEQ